MIVISTKFEFWDSIGSFFLRIRILTSWFIDDSSIKFINFFNTVFENLIKKTPNIVYSLPVDIARDRFYSFKT